MLVSAVTGTPLSIWIVVVNLPFVALGYRQIGGAFAIRSVLAIGGLSVALAIVPFPDVTPDLRADGRVRRVLSRAPGSAWRCAAEPSSTAPRSPRC